MIKDVNFRPGDIVRVFEKIKEGDKSRIQVFEGTILGAGGRGGNKSFCVRKIVADVAVEKIWPVNSPAIEKVTVKSHSKKRVRRSKLYYLRKDK